MFILVYRLLVGPLALYYTVGKIYTVARFFLLSFPLAHLNKTITTLDSDKQVYTISKVY